MAQKVESACNAGDWGLIPEPGRSSREGNGSPLQCSYLENPMDGIAQWATVHGVTKNQTVTFTYIHSRVKRLSRNVLDKDTYLLYGRNRQKIYT